MKLGAFSMSLAVKDLAKSKAFYQKLGFEPYNGIEYDNWMIMKNGDHIIGLFQGMFDDNIMTFNPGWDQNAQPLDEFDDVRVIQQKLLADGVKLEVEADPSSTGPANIVLKDPDGNLIMLDQHV